MFLWLKTLYRKRAVTWPFIFYTIIWTLSHNQLTNLPDFQNLTNLAELNLSFNNLTNTMTNFTNLSNLNNLNLDYNHLNELPSNVLNSIFIENQSGTVPDQIIKQGETCTIQLPIYFQLAEINMLVNPTSQVHNPV